MKKFNKKKVLIFLILILFVNCLSYLLLGNQGKDIQDFPTGYVPILIEGVSKTSFSKGKKVLVMTEKHNLFINEAILIKENESVAQYEIAVKISDYQKYFYQLLHEKLVLLPLTSQPILKERTTYKENTYEIFY